MSVRKKAMVVCGGAGLVNGACAAYWIYEGNFFGVFVSVMLVAACGALGMAWSSVP